MMTDRYGGLTKLLRLLTIKTDFEKPLESGVRKWNLLWRRPVADSLIVYAQNVEFSPRRLLFSPIELELYVYKYSH